jgi:acyl-CoA synthetase (NDP forming)
MSSPETNVVGKLLQEKPTAAKIYGLDPMFAPASVAVLGASERPGTVGRAVLENLLSGKFQGKVYAVNAKHPEVLGRKTYASIRDVPGPVDLVIVATPAATVPQLIGDCVDAGVKAAIVISAGFRERGAAGAALEAQIQEQLRRGSMRLMGPNCLGIMNSAIGSERHVRQRSCQARQRCVPESKWSSASRYSRLERPRTGWLQRHRFHRLDA